MEKRLGLNAKGVIKFLILYLLLVAMWCFFRSYMLMLLLVLLPCCVAASGIFLWSGRDKISVRAMLPDNRVGKNTEFACDICVYNESVACVCVADLTYRFGNVFTGFGEEKQLRLMVLPVEGRDVELRMKSCLAGRVEVEILTFIVYDLLHIFCLKGCHTADDAVVVWPSFEESVEAEINSCVEGFPKENESKKHGVEYNPDYEVREYIPGDELKSIHWKLSAKQDRLMVKERLTSGQEKVNVLLPLGDSSAENDSLLESLYGLGRLLLEKQYPMQLYWPGKEMLRSCFVAEQGELEQVISEILSGSGFAKNARELMEAEHPGEKYILIQTGAYKGAYIQ